MVSWVDRGFDLEIEGEEEEEGGDNEIEIVGDWLMHEIQKDVEAQIVYICIILQCDVFRHMVPPFKETI